MEFKDRFYNLRTEKHWSQQTAADRLGVSRAAISSWETGLRKPTGDMMEALADYFNVSVDYLIGKEEVNEVILDDKQRLLVETSKRLDGANFQALLKYAQFLAGGGNHEAK